jgi:hypothetical protein
MSERVASSAGSAPSTLLAVNAVLAPQETASAKGPRRQTVFLDVRAGETCFHTPMRPPAFGRLGSLQAVRGSGRRLRRALARQAMRNGGR